MATIDLYLFRTAISMETDMTSLLVKVIQIRIYMCMTAKVVYLAMVTSRMLRDSVVQTSQDMALWVQL